MFSGLGRVHHRYHKIVTDQSNIFVQYSFKIYKIFLISCAKFQNVIMCYFE